MNVKPKRVNRTKEELTEHLVTKKEMETIKEFWDEIRKVEDKYGQRIRAFINPNILEGIKPVLTCVPVEKIVVEGKPAEPTKEEETVV
jgi:hypothetical protein